MPYLSGIDLEQDQSLQQAANDRMAQESQERQAQSAGKKQSMVAGGGTILGAILGGIAGNPIMGAQIGGSLGSAVGGMMANKSLQGSPDALGQADKLWKMWQGRPKDKLLQGVEDNQGIATGGFGLPTSDIPSSMVA